jgi:hypothetical protein
MPDILCQYLESAGKRNVKVTVVCREKDLEADARTRLEDLRRVCRFSLRSLGNLHAKCYFNEDSLIITSLNLSNFSEKNREIGVLLTSKEDSSVFKEALQESQEIVNIADEIKGESVVGKLMKGVKSFAESLSEGQEGHCIRCGMSKEYNTNEPFCPTHYRVWKRYRDDNFPEKFCHRCGKEAATSKARPLCDSCYHKS